MGTGIFHEFFIAIHILPTFSVLELVLLPLHVLLVLPFPEELVDDEEEGDDNYGGWVEGQGYQEVVTLLPVEDEALYIFDFEGFDEEEDGWGDLQEDQDIHEFYVWRLRNRAVYSWQEGNKSEHQHCYSGQPRTEALFLEENCKSNQPQNPNRYEHS